MKIISGGEDVSSEANPDETILRVDVPPKLILEMSPDELLAFLKDNREKRRTRPPSKAKQLDLIPPKPKTDNLEGLE